MDEHVIAYWQAWTEDHERRIGQLEGALQAIYHRLLDTIAEEWVAPNPMSSERCSHAQYPGGLCEFILATLEAE